MLVRFYCATHKCGLINCGNGRILFPTACLDPIITKDGWMELDSSEMYCPVASKIDDEADPLHGQPTDSEIAKCETRVQIRDDYTISDATSLGDGGWSFDEKKWSEMSVPDPQSL
jgi:hypothetical protein